MHVMSDDRRKKQAKLFFLIGKVAFSIEKKLVLSNFQVLEKRLDTLHNNSMYTFWTLINCFLRFVLLDIRRKDWPIDFSQWKNGHSVKKFCSQPPPGVTEMIL